MDPPIPKQTTTTTTPTASNDGGPNNLATTVKRKRTKRQRPTILSHSSTSYNSSPPSYSNFPTTTAEDEDTANCLILLSKGHNINISPKNNNMEEFFSGYKFNSKRYIQTSSTGIYVYDCKTCNRTFPSFQALGGHRTSHNKPRISESDKPKPPAPISDQYDQLKSSSKLHECSICGAEFNSGQALGGHMRRHRVVNAVSATNTDLCLIPYSDNQKSRNDGSLCLDLDLNLPAQPEITTVDVSDQDRHRESGFKRQPSVSLSAVSTLVDCYY